MCLDEIEKMAREARDLPHAGFCSRPCELIPSLADAVLRLIDVARKAEILCAEGMESTHEGTIEAANAMWAALSALAKSEDK